MAQWVVDQDGPQAYKNDERSEWYSLGECAGDQQRRDRCEHHLEGRKHGPRDLKALAVRAEGFHVFEEPVAEVSESRHGLGRETASSRKGTT